MRYVTVGFVIAIVLVAVFFGIWSSSLNSNLISDVPLGSTTSTSTPGLTKGEDSMSRMSPQDEEIRSNVLLNLRKEQDLKAVNVKVKNGVVTLTGLAVNDEQKSKAVEIASSIYGVKRVDDHFEIQKLARESIDAGRGFDIDREVKKLKEGAAVTEVPVSMYVGETRAVVLVLSPEVAKAKDVETKLRDELSTLSRQMPSKKLEETTRIESDKAMFGRFMEAKLTGQGFEISSVTPERQPVTNDHNTQWKWDVKAVSPGEQSLYLSMNAIFEIQNGEKTRAINTFNKVVKVETVKESRAERVGSFISDNWKWLLATIVFPIGGAAWGYMRHKRKAESVE